MKSDAPETYPMQFKDKIDEYLWKEHNLLGGCCSSVESVKYAVAREVAEKLTDTFIEKSCTWLEPVLKNYAGYYRGKDVLGDFRKYMKGE